jgi:hypothetical protein
MVLKGRVQASGRRRRSGSMPRVWRSLMRGSRYWRQAVASATPGPYSRVVSWLDGRDDRRSMS